MKTEILSTRRLNDITVQKSFEFRVYETIPLIPFGQVVTYRHIEELISACECAQQIGLSLKRLPLPSKIPWHRVINAKREVSINVDRAGTDVSK